MKVVRTNRPELDARGAEVVAAGLRAAVSERSPVVLGIVGGRSVGGVFAHLCRADVPWADVHVFLADERVVPITSDESNFLQAQADFLADLVDSGALPGANVHPFLARPDTPGLGLDAYNDALRGVGGRFDVVLLSAGEDGHCASLFPDHPSIRHDADGFILVEDSPKPPPERVSASRRLLEGAKTAVVLFVGEAKRAALGLFEDPSVDVEHCPSKLVQAVPDSWLLTDLTEAPALTPSS